MINFCMKHIYNLLTKKTFLFKLTVSAEYYLDSIIVTPCVSGMTLY